MADIYMPNDRVDGRIVIASVWLRDDEDDTSILTLELEPFARGETNYRVVQYGWKHDEWYKRYVEGEFMNIVPAVECYIQNGGDY